MHFYAFFNHSYSSIFEIALRINPLFFLYIAQEQTAQNANLALRSSLFALFLKSLIRSQNQGLLKSEERLSDFKERCTQLCKCPVQLWDWPTDDSKKKALGRLPLLYGLWEGGKKCWVWPVDGKWGIFKEVDRERNTILYLYCSERRSVFFCLRSISALTTLLPSQYILFTPELIASLIQIANSLVAN